MAALIATFIAPRLVVPVVVIEVLLGIAIGPQALDIVHLDATTHFFANLGLGMLFFFDGYEIDFARIRGRPLHLGGTGWLLSLALAYGLAPLPRLHDRTALGFFCATELPLVVAITTLAQAHHEMRAPTASALVGAAVISTLVFPLVGLRLRRGRTEEPAPQLQPAA